MEKVVARASLKDPKQDRAYWLSRSPEERIAAVEVLRKQVHPEYDLSEVKIEKVARVTNLTGKK